MSKNNPLQDRIPSNLSDEIEKTFADKMASDVLRKRVKEIFDECIDSVPFMDKVRDYAGREIERRVNQSIGFWIKTIFIPLAVTLVTYFVLKILNLKP
jgi:hypothetical protein